MKTNAAEQTEGRVLEILESYLAERRAGHPPAQETLLARHPDLAEPLAASLRALDFVHDAGRSIDTPESLPESACEGRVLGDFRLVREIARGGMAVVYEAEQVSLGRRVALKVLPFAAVLDPKQLQRFKNEAQAAAHIQHPHIVPVHAVGCERGVHYYAMQYVEGQSLAVAIHDMKEGRSGTGPKTPISSHGSNREPAFIRMAVALGVQAAEALDHAHQLGIVHRDVKPGNLLVDLAGTAWITDFGLAHSHKDVGLTMTGELLGTIRYMSPEQALAKRVPIDHRTDVYSLGATLYELFTLVPAFPGEDAPRVLQDIASKEPVPPRRLNPALPHDVETVLLKAMSKDPAGRYATAQEMADDLVRFLEHRPIEAKRPGVLRRTAKWSRRHRALVGTVAGVLVLAVAGLAIGAALLWHEQEQTRTAFGRAEANLTLALKALDQIYVDEAEGNPRIREGLSRELLEKGLGFYEEFARENAHNQRVGFLLGRAHHRAGLIFRTVGLEDRAKEAFDRAILTYREALRLKPNSAGGHYSLGLTLAAGGDTDGAIRELRESSRLAPENAWAHYRIGSVFLFKKGDLDSAIQELREALRLKPDFAAAHDALGVALLRKGDLDSAIREYREAVRLEPSYATGHVNLGEALTAHGDHDDAIRECREALRLEPSNSRAHYILGNALYAKGDRENAIPEFLEAIRLTPDLRGVHNSLGNAFRVKRDWESAIREYREAIRLEPGDAVLHHNLGITLRANGDVDGAMLELQEAIRLRPSNGESHSSLAFVLSAKGKVKDAIRESREAIRLEPDFFAAHFGLGNALLADGDVDGAIGEYREVIRLKPDFPEAHYSLGVSLLQKGDWGGAIPEFREAIRLRPGLAGAHYNLGNALAGKGDREGAIQEYNEAIRLAPNDAIPHYNLGTLLLENGDRSGAIQEFREAIRLKPDMAEAHNNLGDALRMNGNLEGAIRELREAIRLRSDVAGTHINLGYALGGQGNTAGAIQEFREAIRLKPDDASAHCGLGVALTLKGELESGIQACREAIRLKPDTADAHHYLGIALHAKGDWDGAIQEFRETIRLKPDLADAHYNLGLSLHAKGDWDGAIKENLETIRLKPDHAMAHNNLGLALVRQGHFREALPWYRKARELGSSHPDWAYPTKERLERVERMAELEGRLDQILPGEARPRDAADRIVFAEMLHWKSDDPAAARMYAEAFAEDASLAEDLAKGHRYNASCAASLAAAREGADTAQWRARALEWLRADLAAHEKAPVGLAAMLDHWKRDPDLASIRDRIADLPEPEREAWRGLWAAVDEALARARQAPR